MIQSDSYKIRFCLDFGGQLQILLHPGSSYYHKNKKATNKKIKIRRMQYIDLLHIYLSDLFPIVLSLALPAVPAPLRENSRSVLLSNSCLVKGLSSSSSSESSPLLISSYDGGCTCSLAVLSAVTTAGNSIAWSLVVRPI